MSPDGIWLSRPAPPLSLEEQQIVERFENAPDGLGRHNMTTYTRGCRCDECRTAKRENQARYVAKARYAGRVSSHGSSGYQQGCRCDVCYGYNSASCARRRGA